MILVSLFISKCAVAQNVSAMGSNDRDVVLKNIPDTINGVLHNSEDSMYSLINQITFLERKVCKGYIFSNYNIPNYNKHTSAQNYHSPETIKKVSTIKLNGFVNYEYYYNQHIDTPFAAKAFEQHTISAQLKITIKNKYPLVLNFSNRLTNNPFFKNYLDIGLQFDRVSYLNSLKNSYANAVNHSNPFQQILLQIQQELKTTEGEYSKLRKELNDPHWVQTIVKERESFLQSNSNKSAATLGNKEKELGKYSGTDSIKSESSEEFGFVKKTALFNINKSILSSFTPPKYDLLPSSQKRPGDLDSIGIKREKDSLNAKSPDSTYQFVFGLKDSVLKVVKDSTILKTHRLSDQANKQLTVMRKTPTEEWYEKQLMVLDSIKTKKDSLFQYSKKVEGLFKQAQNADVITGNINNRKQQLLKYGNPDNAVTKLDNILLNVKSFGIGRTSIDYSDLTARGLSILGIQAEFEPNLYYAFAAGKVNYRFRDFFVNTPSVNNNQEYYIVRIGNEKIKRIRIIGSAFYGKSNRLSLNNPTINLFSGYSIFTSYHISRTNFIEAEIAKTYLPVSLNPGLIKDKNPGLFDWSKNNNLGFEAKAHFLFMKSNTAVDGYYKRIGESFQSISFLTNDQIQKAWNIKVEQRLFKSKLVITGMLRQNDFVNPSFSHNYNTSSVFKTLTATFRKKKLPFFSIGYYPGTQLVKNDSGSIAENVYYMFNITSGYSTRIKSINYTSVVVYNSFINKSTDSGFTYFKANSWSFNQNFSSKIIQVQSGFTLTKQPALQYYSIDASVDITKVKWVSFGFGGRYNKVKEGDDYWGWKGNIQFHFGKLGELQGSYDKQFIPTNTKQLTGADIGRIGWIKHF